MNGKDAIRALENSVEDLNATIYQLNLQNQSDSVLGFERKMNELKSEEVIVKRAMRRATRLDKLSDEVEALLGRLRGLEDGARLTSSFINDTAAKVDGLHEDIAKIDGKSRAAAAVISEFQASISKSASLATNAVAEVSTIHDRAKSFEDQIVEFKDQFAVLVTDAEELKSATSEAVTQQIDKLVEELASHLTESNENVSDSVSKAGSQVERALKAAETAEAVREENAASLLEQTVGSFDAESSKAIASSREIVAHHEEQTKDLIMRLRKIEEQIDGAILKATGHTLFHTFQKRQEDLAKSARVWAIALGCCVIFSAAAGITFLFFLKYFPSYGPAIYFKLSLSLPFIAAMTFCGWQYTRERRLEEEYAFKSNISLSLKPYQQLVDELVDKNDPIERAKYTAFIISSINKVFTSPTGLVFDSDVVPGDEATALLKATIEGAKDLINVKSGS